MIYNSRSTSCAEADEMTTARKSWREMSQFIKWCEDERSKIARVVFVDGEWKWQSHISHRQLQLIRANNGSVVFIGLRRLWTDCSSASKHNSIGFQLWSGWWWWWWRGSEVVELLSRLYADFPRLIHPHTQLHLDPLELQYSRRATQWTLLLEDLVSFIELQLKRLGKKSFSKLDSWLKKSWMMAKIKSESGAKLIHNRFRCGIAKSESKHHRVFAFLESLRINYRRRKK